MSSSLRSSHGNITSSGSIDKRRKVRKGTFSCWECKRRKIRCELKSASSAVCAYCRRSGLPCISQDFDEPVDSDGGEVNRRIDRVEALVHSLIHQKKNRLTRLLENNENSSPQRASTSKAPSPSHLLASSRDLISEYRSLSGYLNSTLPPPAAVTLIMARGRLPFEMLLQPGRVSDASSNPGALSLLTPSKTHPVLFARRLIQLALSLQRLDTMDSTCAEQKDMSLNEPFCEAANRYVGVARYVTSQDRLVNSLEGLETLMLEGCYHINGGNFQSAWHIFRRALGIAQLMDLPQLAEGIGGRTEFIWFRFIYCDRFLSLMMGCEFAVADDNFAGKHQMARDTPVGKLERIHVVVSGRIITRNLRMQNEQCSEKSNDDGYNGYQETSSIDYELKQAARYLPVRWWMLPTTDNLTSDPDGVENNAKLITQMHHHYLLVLAHQPCLLQRLRSPPAPNSTDCIYSKTAVVSSSREVLACVLLFRSVHPAPAYFPGIDHKAITASTTLILAHLDEHRLGFCANVLEHQRPHDLGMVESVISILATVSGAKRDELTRSGVEYLKRLLRIEADAAHGTNYLAFGDKDVPSEAKRTGLSFQVPYFGMTYIVRQGRYESTIDSLRHDSIEFVPTTEKPSSKHLATQQPAKDNARSCGSSSQTLRPLNRVLTTFNPSPGTSGVSESGAQLHLPQCINSTDQAEVSEDAHDGLHPDLDATVFNMFVCEESENSVLEGMIDGDLSDLIP